jgi:hypothetical protein
MSSEVVEALRASLARPLSAAKRIEQAYSLAETDEERHEIRDLAIAEAAYAASADEVAELQHAAGIISEYDEEELAADEDARYQQMDPPAYGASDVLQALAGLDYRFQHGELSRHDYMTQQGELMTKLADAEAADAEARRAYEAGEVRPKEVEIAPLGGTDQDPNRIMVSGGEDWDAKVAATNSPAELDALINAQRGGNRLVTEDGVGDMGRLPA